MGEPADGTQSRATKGAATCSAGMAPLRPAGVLVWSVMRRGGRTTTKRVPGASAQAERTKPSAARFAAT